MLKLSTSALLKNQMISFRLFILLARKARRRFATGLVLSFGYLMSPSISCRRPSGSPHCPAGTPIFLQEPTTTFAISYLLD